jgi:hypothetical protein
MAFPKRLDLIQYRGTVDLKKDRIGSMKPVDLKSAWQYSEIGLGHLPPADNRRGEVPRRNTSRHVQNMLQDGNAGTILSKHIFVMNEK